MKQPKPQVKKELKETIYIVVTKRGVQNKNVYKNPPPLKTGELYAQLHLDLDDRIFDVPPIVGTLRVTAEDVQNKKIKELEFELKRLKESDEVE